MKQVILITFIFLTLNVLGQDSLRSKKNTYYFELLGNSNNIISVNLERQFKINEYLLLTSRIGIGFPISFENIERRNSGGFEIIKDDHRKYHIPTELNLSIGKNHYFETSVGLTPLIHRTRVTYSPNTFRLLFPVRFGYRYQKVNKKYYLRVGYMRNFVLYTSDPYLYDSKSFDFFGFGYGRYFK